MKDKVINGARGPSRIYTPYAAKSVTMLSHRGGNQEAKKCCKLKNAKSSPSHSLVRSWTFDFATPFWRLGITFFLHC